METKMTKEEAENGRDGTIIGGPEQANTVHDGFNANVISQNLLWKKSVHSR